MQNDIKLQFEELEYFVNDNVVICKMWAYLSSDDFLFNTSLSSKGVAYPHDGDTFDVETGKKVARGKAELELYKKAKNILKEEMRDYAKNVKRCAICIDELESFIDHNKSYLSKF